MIVPVVPIHISIVEAFICVPVGSVAAFPFVVLVPVVGVSVGVPVVVVPFVALEVVEGVKVPSVSVVLSFVFLVVVDYDILVYSLLKSACILYASLVPVVDTVFDLVLLLA